jgi:hypothetical protein
LPDGWLWHIRSEKIIILVVKTAKLLLTPQSDYFVGRFWFSYSLMIAIERKLRNVWVLWWLQRFKAWVFSLEWVLLLTIGIMSTLVGKLNRNVGWKVWLVQNAWILYVTEADYLCQVNFFGDGYLVALCKFKQILVELLIVYTLGLQRLQEYSEVVVLRAEFGKEID